MSEKVVWILGSGFSKSLGAPLLSQLFRHSALRPIRAAYDYYVGDALKEAEQIIDLYLAGARGLSRNDPLEELWEHAEEFIETLDLVRDGASYVNLKNLCEQLAKRKGSGPFLLSGGSDVENRALIESMHECAIRLLAAECAVFLRDGVEGERWAPYHDWAMSLGPQDTILTFNYDCVPDRLSRRRTNKGLAELCIPDPDELANGPNERSRAPGPPTATILKLHGSVDWLRRMDDHGRDVIRNARRWRGTTERSIAAVWCENREIAIASPGPTKRRMVEEGGPLEPVWRAARDAIHKADRVVMIGYQMPQTDAYTRQWLTNELRRNHVAKGSGQLGVMTVLGVDTNKAASRRLTGILENITPGHIKVDSLPMYAEDFLGIVGPNI